MSDRGHHCPFLNRADSRCSDHFSLDQLDHAFDYCFGYYDACASYQQLLAERQARRSSGPGPWAGRMAEYADDEHVEPARGGGKSLVQVRVRGR